MNNEVLWPTELLGCFDTIERLVYIICCSFLPCGNNWPSMMDRNPFLPSIFAFSHHHHLLPCVGALNDGVHQIYQNQWWSPCCWPISHTIAFAPVKVCMRPSIRIEVYKRTVTLWHMTNRSSCTVSIFETSWPALIILQPTRMGNLVSRVKYCWTCPWNLSQRYCRSFISPADHSMFIQFVGHITASSHHLLLVSLVCKIFHLDLPSVTWRKAAVILHICLRSKYSSSLAMVLLIVWPIMSVWWFRPCWASIPNAAWEIRCKGCQYGELSLLGGSSSSTWKKLWQQRKLTSWNYSLWCNVYYIRT